MKSRAPKRPSLNSKRNRNVASVPASKATPHKKSSGTKSLKGRSPAHTSGQKKKSIPSPNEAQHPKTTRRGLAPKNFRQYSALSNEAQEQWNRVAHVIQKVRNEGISVTRAAKEFGIDRKKVIELGGSALRKQKNGRYKAKSFDRLLRVLVIPSLDGLREIAVRDSRTASKIAEYSDAVHRFLQTGDQSKLRKFKRLRINDAEGKRIKLVTDVQELTRLGSAGVLSFESLYARVA